MVDRSLIVVGAFDWITPLMAFVQDFLHGPVSDFGIPTAAGWSRRDIKRLLKKQGIPVWGLMLNLSGDILMFTVSRAYAQPAYDLFQQEGVPLLCVPAGVVNSPPLQPYVPLSTSSGT